MYITTDSHGAFLRDSSQQLEPSESIDRQAQAEGGTYDWLHIRLFLQHLSSLQRANLN
jgi:hypothetical protein